MAWLKRLCCRHDYKYTELEHCETICECVKCGKIEVRSLADMHH